MSLIGTVVLAVLFLGFPFYWGAFGHPSVLLPIIWAVLIAALVNARRWRHVEAALLPAFIITLLLSAVASSVAFALGHMLSR